jgi:hypothetical protein
MNGSYWRMGGTSSAQENLVVELIRYLQDRLLHAIKTGTGAP